MRCTLAVYLSLLAFSFADKIKLRIHPTPDDPQSSLIWYNQSTSDKWSQKLDNFLEVYRTPLLTEGREEHLVSCSYEKYPSSESVCNIRTEDFKPCTASNFFGFKQGSPCVFIELESVLGWKPRYFASMKSLPKGMPQALKYQIEDLTANVKMWHTIWVACEGLTPADKEFIGSTVTIPQPGFPGYYFPYIGQKGYLNPIIAVQFERPQVGVIINIVCKAWAPGILHNSNKPLGMAMFELLFD
ncbi:sodium/potassium-transporting ATPase subunit beta-2 [Halyomorpha halys]|uniref:sodium/potassium-transporting ATPase subunit beta-2 n=1 Tax=Halyomorpha halys TaxID=286706 RepID=UPI0006D4F3BE|nr:sodium/potassium-transporting ATPase subunit beta-2-like [Halyomorpha halys]